ncbi:S8 family peptidase [Bacteroidota bacterium]
MKNILAYNLKMIRRIFVFSLLLVFTSLNVISQNLENRIDISKKNKIAPNINISSKSSQKIDIRVQVNDITAFNNWLEKNASGLKYSKTKYSDIYEIKEINNDQILRLSYNKFVNFIDVSNRNVVENRLMDGSDLAANKIESVHIRYPEYAGLGLTVSVKENLFDTTDIDYNGRIKNIKNSSGVLSLHATMMSTLIAGAGNNGPKGKGVARKAEITSSDFSNLFPDDNALILNDKISVQNHSYGIDQVENYYGLESQQYDIQCNDLQEVLHVFSSGNLGTDTSIIGTYAGIEGYANLTGQFKTAKNIITVGEIDSYGKVKKLSSRGPAFDGRVKPELVAYGYNGSSESAALVSGISLLVQNAYKDNNGNLPHASLIKSILINSADDVGRSEIDFEAGYGSVDALGAIETVLENRFITDKLSESQEKVFNISIPENTNIFKVTIVWHDIEADAGSEKALINDIDMELHEISSGSVWEPWMLNHYPHIDSISKLAVRAKDHINNIEQITLTEPNAGVYELHVYGNKIQNEQSFSIAYEYEGGFQWIFPFKENSLKAYEIYQIRWGWEMASETGSIEYRKIDDGTWHILDELIDFTDNYYEWQVLDTSALVQIRLKSNNNEFLSDTFLISRTPDLSVGMNCDDEALIFWNSIFNADSYEIYRLEDKFLEPFLITTDTFLIIEDDEMEYLNYSVSPVVNEVKGFRSKTINYSTQNVDCYFISFIPRQYVTDTVLLNLKLASNYRLLALNLERIENGNYNIVQRIEPVLNNNFELIDNNPNPNRNVYRIRLERDDLKEIISHEEEVFFNPPGSLLVFPNPLNRNQELNIIDGEDGATTVRIYDSSGRIYYYEETNYGMIKSIPMDKFIPGIYFIELKSDQGFKKIRKIIVL